MRTFVWDIECTNLRSDIGTLIVVVFGELNGDGEIKKYYVNDIVSSKGEKNLAKWTLKMVESCDILIGHNSVSFDKNFVNGVLVRLGLPKMPKRIHLDTMFAARYGLKGLYQSVSLENLCDILNVGIKKDKPSKHDWRKANILDVKSIRRLIFRCKEDVRATNGLWLKLKEHQYSWRGV